MLPSKKVRYDFPEVFEIHVTHLVPFHNGVFEGKNLNGIARIGTKPPPTHGAILRES